MQESSSPANATLNSQSSNTGALDNETETGNEEVTVKMAKQTLAELKWLAEYMGVLPSNALRQAIATQAYLEQEAAKGNEILVRKQDGLYKLTKHRVWQDES